MIECAYRWLSCTHQSSPGRRVWIYQQKLGPWWWLRGWGLDLQTANGSLNSVTAGTSLLNHLFGYATPVPAHICPAKWAARPRCCPQYLCGPVSLPSPNRICKYRNRNRIWLVSCVAAKCCRFRALINHRLVKLLEIFVSSLASGSRRKIYSALKRRTEIRQDIRIMDIKILCICIDNNQIIYGGWTQSPKCYPPSRAKPSLIIIRWLIRLTLTGFNQTIWNIFNNNSRNFSSLSSSSSSI